MRWQHEIHEILERANWPPRTDTIRMSPWPRLVALAALGWVVAEIWNRLAELETNALSTSGRPLERTSR